MKENEKKQLICMGVYFKCASPPSPWEPSCELPASDTPERPVHEMWRIVSSGSGDDVSTAAFSWALLYILLPDAPGACYYKCPC